MSGLCGCVFRDAVKEGDHTGFFLRVAQLFRDVVTRGGGHTGFFLRAAQLFLML